MELRQGGIRLLAAALFAVLGLSGCAMRTYSLTKDRIDQDLSSGNRGFIVGQGKLEETQRPSTRTIQVVEIEFPRLPKFSRKKAINKQAPRITKDVDGPGNQGIISQSEGAAQAPTAIKEKYTIKKGDTFQSIALKYYGTTKKWMALYDANKATVKAANKIYPGQIIDIPDFPVSKTLEQKQNLK